MIQIILTAFQLCWTPADFNVDGSPVTGIDHFDIYYGRTADYDRQVRVPGYQTCANIRAAEGVWYAVVTQTNPAQEESWYSNVVRKTETRLEGPGGGRLIGPTDGRLITEDE